MECKSGVQQRAGLEVKRRCSHHDVAVQMVFEVMRKT